MGDFILMVLCHVLVIVCYEIHFYFCTFLCILLVLSVYICITFMFVEAYWESVNTDVYPEKFEYMWTKQRIIPYYRVIVYLSTSSKIHPIVPNQMTSIVLWWWCFINQYLINFIILYILVSLFFGEQNVKQVFAHSFTISFCLNSNKINCSAHFNFIYRFFTNFQARKSQNRSE